MFAAAIALRPRHISHYQLTLEPGTVFYHRPPSLPDEDDIWQMQVECQQALAAQRLSSSMRSRPTRSADARCTHNLNYWQFGDYLGIGAGAHGKLTDASAASIGRTAHVRQPRQYLEAIEAGKSALERWTILRRRPAFRIHAQCAATAEWLHEANSSSQGPGCRWTRSLSRFWRRRRNRGMIEAMRSSGICRPTEFGRRFLNDLQALFLPKRSPASGSGSPRQVVNLL